MVEVHVIHGRRLVQEVPEEIPGGCANVHKIPHRRLVQEVPENHLGACAGWVSLMDHDHQWIPGHRVQLEEIRDVFHELEGLVVHRSLHHVPVVRGAMEDLTPELPPEVPVARMVVQVEHIDAPGRDLIAWPLLRQGANKAWCHGRAGGAWKLEDLKDSRSLRGKNMNQL